MNLNLSSLCVLCHVIDTILISLQHANIYHRICLGKANLMQCTNLGKVVPGLMCLHKSYLFNVKNRLILVSTLTRKLAAYSYCHHLHFPDFQAILTQHTACTELQKLSRQLQCLKENIFMTHEGENVTKIKANFWQYLHVGIIVNKKVSVFSF